MARPLPGQRRIDKPRLAELLGENRLLTIAKQLAADGTKTAGGWRRQLQKWRNEGNNTQTYVSQDNAERLSAALGVSPDDWSTPFTEVDRLEQQLARQEKLAALAQEKARDIRQQLRDAKLLPPSQGA